MTPTMDLNRVYRTDDRVLLRHALVSVADKRGLVALVSGLWAVAPTLHLYSTGGTLTVLQELARGSGHEAQVHAISDYTGQPEMQGGLVKTLDYRIYLGLLSERYNVDHAADLERVSAIPFDLTVCNFYPFAAAAAKASERPRERVEELRTHIDIGGPTMVRASGKNFLRVATLCRPDDYGPFLKQVTANGGHTTLAQRGALAATAFTVTAEYEATIMNQLGAVLSREWVDGYDTTTPDSHADSSSVEENPR